MLFSSISNIFPVKGGVAYSTANMILDSISEQRKMNGLVSLSLQLGPWIGGGLVKNNEDIIKMSSIGIGGIHIENGMKTLLQLCTRNDDSGATIFFCPLVHEKLPISHMTSALNHNKPITVSSVSTELKKLQVSGDRQYDLDQHLTINIIFGIYCYR